MILNTLDSPQKLANYVTDNARLQVFFMQYLSLTSIEDKKKYEENFWSKVESLPIKEQEEIKKAHHQSLQRLLDRTGSVIHFLKEELNAQLV
jgi:hypothetical protein